MKNELFLSVETSDDEWFEIFSYEETETDLKDIKAIIKIYDVLKSRGYDMTGISRL